MLNIKTENIYKNKQSKKSNPMFFNDRALFFWVLFFCEFFFLFFAWFFPTIVFIPRFFYSVEFSSIYSICIFTVNDHSVN